MEQVEMRVIGAGTDWMDADMDNPIIQHVLGILTADVSAPIRRVKIDFDRFVCEYRIKKI